MENKTFIIPDNNGSQNMDPALLLAMSQNGGFGNGAMWMWPMFMWMMFPWLFGANGFGGFGGNNGSVLGTGFLSNQLNENQQTDTLLQAINGRAEAINLLANVLNTDVNSVQNGINAIQNAILSVGNQVGLSGQQVINSIQSGNAALSQQLCQCCCDNRFAIAQQTNALQAQAASNHAAATLQAAQIEAADQLAVCQQTNQLGSQADRNTNSLMNAIAAQSTMITKEFCELKERELQNKIDALTAENAILRDKEATEAQTKQLTGMFNVLQNEITALKASQPQTITLPYNQYSVVPTWAANVGSDFVASYWANRLSQATTTTPTTGGTTA